MDKLDINRGTEDWLIAFLNGELDSEEERKVEEWLDDSPENRRIYEALIKDYLHIRWAQELLSIRKDKAREAVFSAIRRKKHLWWRYGAAASLALLCMLSAYLFFGEKQPGESPEPLLTVVHPIRPQAVLTLSSGEKVKVTASRQDICEQDGLLLRIDTSGAIRYDSLANAPVSNELRYNRIEVPRGGEYKLLLADGTQVWMNSESSLTYPIQFNGDSREVHMQGEVCFKVIKDKRPFIVKTGSLSVEVLGTFFNVEAYPEDRTVTTTLVEGRVRVSDGERDCILSPDRQLIAGAGEWVTHDIEAATVIRWTEGVCYFSETSLETIMNKLARWYDVEVFFASESAKKAHFSLEIERYADIATLLSKIERVGRVRFKVSGRTVIVEE